MHTEGVYTLQSSFLIVASTHLHPTLKIIDDTVRQHFQKRLFSPNHNVMFHFGPLWRVILKSSGGDGSGERQLGADESPQQREHDVFRESFALVSTWPE